MTKLELLATTMWMEFVPDTFNLPSLWISPLFVKLSVTVISLVALFVNTLDDAIVNPF